MKNYLNILKIIRQKIPSKFTILVDFSLPNLQIPRKIKNSGHFHLNTVLFSGKNPNFYGFNYLINR